MEFFTTIVFLIFHFQIIYCSPFTIMENKMKQDIMADEVLNTCLDSSRHKKEPGPEENLFDECSPWSGKSCCTTETTEKIHKFSLYSLDYDMCPQKNMSEECKKHFIRDTCFYECSPNVGPWREKVDAIDRKERFRNVPLCASDCESWYLACAEDYTCTDNWSKNYKITAAGTDICPGDPESTCKPIKTVFKTSKSFCEKIWDYSWKVVDDAEPCMRTSFSLYENPNDQVAEKYAVEKYGSASIETHSSVSIIKPNIFIIFMISFLSFLILNQYK